MSKMRIRVQELIVGWCDIDLHINDKLISFHASYLGPNPIASLIETCADMKQAVTVKETFEEEILWYKEPGLLQIKADLDLNSIVHFNISDKNEDQTINKEWHESVPFDDFLQAIFSEGCRVLKAYGLHGYYSAWSNNEDFPLRCLLQLISKNDWDGFAYSYSTWEEEKKAISILLENTSVEGEKHFEECNIFYESWQMQCCGEAFSVGDRVEWTGELPFEHPVADGLIIDFVEEHHGSAFLSIKGTVERIFSHCSEFPKGQRCANYYKAGIKSTELQTANGHESENPDDEKTERTFWGYVVKLKDVVVKPLAMNKNI